MIIGQPSNHPNPDPDPNPNPNPNPNQADLCAAFAAQGLERCVRVRVRVRARDRATTRATARLALSATPESYP